jgi:hypothetical protein
MKTGGGTFQMSNAMWKKDIRKFGLTQLGLSVVWLILFVFLSMAQERSVAMFAMVILFLSVNFSVGLTLLLVYFYYGERTHNTPKAAEPQPQDLGGTQGEEKGGSAVSGGEP